ncbi:uncharacterized protein JCM6883_002610 [Sporobolomyces salmoneus]|uniref:uncharacterized protein n=1 Tax=Sporobolomyces salmoneus TaxID=183962 RepID=UPI003179B5EA
MNTLLRSSILQRSTVSPSRSKRFLSTTSPRPVHPPHYTPIQWAKKFIPTEAYPLILLASSMCCYGLYHGYSRIVQVPGELRLVPNRLEERREREPWEEERAMRGVW